MLFASLIGATSTFAQDPQPVSFRKEVAPILQDRCVRCHGPNRSEAGYRVDNYNDFLKGAQPTKKGIVAKDLNASEMYRRITSFKREERMPAEDDRLPQNQIDLFKRWILEGAIYDADDPAASLVSIIPPVTHPDPPEAYAKPLPITALAFSADGNEVFVSGQNEITVWNASTGKLSRRITNVSRQTFALALTPDGTLLAAAGGNADKGGEIRLFDPSTGKLVRVAAATYSLVWDMTFSADGKMLAAAVSDGSVGLFDVANGRLKTLLPADEEMAMSVAFSKDGQRLLTGGRDQAAKLWDLSTAKLLQTFAGHDQAVMSVAFSADEKSALSVGRGESVQLWNLESAKAEKEVAPSEEGAYRFIRSGDALIILGMDKQVRVLDAATLAPRRTYAGHSAFLLTAALAPKKSLLVTGDFEGNVKVWNTETGAEAASFVAAPGYVPGAEDSNE